jgi:HSP20 family protein
MSDMTIWEPMRDLMTMRDWMDNAMNEFWGRNRSLLRGYDALAVDMFQTENDVVVKATLPGVKADDIKISVTGDVLTIRGEVKHEEEVKNAAYHLRERSYGSFSRSIPLPTSVVADRAHAEFEDGVLTLRLPKAEEVRPKTIAVKAK